MKITFNSNESNTLTIRFACPYCQQEATSKSISLTSLGSVKSTDHEAICENCEEEFPFILFYTKDESFIEFEGNDILNVRIDTV